MIHTVKGFGIVNKAEIDVFLEVLQVNHTSKTNKFIEKEIRCVVASVRGWGKEKLEFHGSHLAEAWLGDF